MRKLLLTFFALCGIGLSGAVVAQVAAGDPGSIEDGFIVEGNLVRPGNIIQSITMSETNPHDFNAKQCRKICDGNSNCNAYRYQRVSKDRKPECLLRMLALPGGANRSHGYIAADAGTKISFIENDLGMEVTPGQAININASVGFTVPTNDPMACIDACWRDPNCKGATFIAKGVRNSRQPASCDQFTQLGPLTNRQPVAGVISAVKKSASASSSSKLPIIQKPTITPRPAPVIQRPGRTILTIPDKSEPEENPSLSDDIDAEPES